MEQDFASMKRLPRNNTPELMKYLATHGHVTRVCKTPYGTVIDCDDYIRQATPEELEARKQNYLQTASRLAYCRRYD